MRRRNLLTALTVIIVLVIAGIGYGVYSHRIPGLSGLAKDSGNNVSDYSAIFLTNGQVYFGKVYTGGEGLDLKDIYYLQVNQQIQPTTTGATPAAEANNVVLVKLGQELHGPNDEMHINRSQILFTESLKSDSKVVKAIAADKSK